MTAVLVSLLVLLAACGGDGPGNDDTLWTGLSGLVIAVLLVVVLLRWLNRRDP